MKILFEIKKITIFAIQIYSIMSDTTLILISVGVVVFGGGLLLKKIGNKSSEETDNVVVPLKIQAYERMLLYLERIRLSVIVKRVFMPGMSRSDLQFALIQNVQDEFEHNLAQRLYVSEEVWMMIVVTKDDTLKHINEAFASNPDADAATMAQIIASMSNSLIDKTVISIKKEFNNI